MPPGRKGAEFRLSLPSISWRGGGCFRKTLGVPRKRRPGGAAQLVLPPRPGDQVFGRLFMGAASQPGGFYTWGRRDLGGKLPETLTRTLLGGEIGGLRAGEMHTQTQARGGNAPARGAEWEGLLVADHPNPFFRPFPTFAQVPFSGPARRNAPLREPASRPQRVRGRGGPTDPDCRAPSHTTRVASPLSSPRDSPAAGQEGRAASSRAGFPRRGAPGPGGPILPPEPGREDSCGGTSTDSPYLERSELAARLSPRGLGRSRGRPEASPQNALFYRLVQTRPHHHTPFLGKPNAQTTPKATRSPKKGALLIGKTPALPSAPPVIEITNEL